MTTQKMKFSIKDLVIKCDDICGFVRIRTHLLKKSFMENFFFKVYPSKILVSLLRISLLCTYGQKQLPEVFYKKGVLKNFSQFTGNTCSRLSFLIKLQTLGLQLY